MAPRRTQWHHELYVPMRALDPPRRPQWKPRRGPTMMDKRGGTRRVLFARISIAQAGRRLGSRSFEFLGLSARDLPT